MVGKRLFAVILIFYRISKNSLNIQTYLISLMDVSRDLCVTDKIDFAL